MTQSEPHNMPTPLKTGVIWNLASLGFLALAGLVLNFAIARIYGSEALGLFNIVFALYIFASQFGAFGLHFSVLRAVSAHQLENPDKAAEAATSGVVATVIATTLVTVVAWALIPFVESIYGDKAEGIGTACRVILPGLWAFSLNKTLFNIINGARHMRIFAVLQALRYVLMLIAFVVFVMRGVPAAYLTAVFSVAEVVLLPILFVAARRAISLWRSAPGWLSRHSWFGARVFLSGAILELNTRVDVLMLGFFLDARAAGIYSVAALVAEGAAQAVFAVRNNINPLLTPMVETRDVAGLRALSRKSVLYFTPFMLTVTLVAWGLYPVFCQLMFPDPVFLTAQPVLLILLLGVTLSCGLMVFNMILSQAARPASHTLYVALILVSNFILNALLIPSMGITGAAVATATTYVISVFLLIILTRRLLGLRLLL